MTKFIVLRMTAVVLTSYSLALSHLYSQLKSIQYCKFTLIFFYFTMNSYILYFRFIFIINMMIFCILMQVIHAQLPELLPCIVQNIINLNAMVIERRIIEFSTLPGYSLQELHDIT